MSCRNTILIQLRNPFGPDDPSPVLRVYDDVRILRLKRAFFEDTLCQVAAVEGADLKIAVAPPARSVWARESLGRLAERYPRRRSFKSLPERTEIITQPVAPTEQRSAENLKYCLDSGYHNIVLMSGYIPTIKPNLLERALHNLSRHPLILGPTIEGGCYLIGLRSDLPEAAGMVSIGSDVAYQNSTAALREAGLTWQEIDLSYDVSHQEDLEFIVREINHCRYTGDEETAQCTEALLAEFMKESGLAGDGSGTR